MKCDKFCSVTSTGRLKFLLARLDLPPTDFNLDLILVLVSYLGPVAHHRNGERRNKIGEHLWSHSKLFYLIRSKP